MVRVRQVCMRPGGGLVHPLELLHSWLALSSLGGVRGGLLAAARACAWARLMRPSWLSRARGLSAGEGLDP
jgi:hypothetical protein